MTQAYTWGSILAVVVFSSAGDVLLAKAMTRIGDLGQLFARAGLFAVLRAIFASGLFMSAIVCMALAYFSMLMALSWADLSLAAPATASLTFVFSAIAAKYFLQEDVNPRRWIAVGLVCIGVILLAH